MRLAFILPRAINLLDYSQSKTIPRLTNSSGCNKAVDLALGSRDPWRSFSKLLQDSSDLVAAPTLEDFRQD
jgi:hypothetical protein